MNKKHTFYFGFVLTTIIGLQACGTTNEVLDEKPSEVIVEVMDIAFKNVASGNLQGDGAEGINEGGIVVNSQEEWTTLTTKMNSVNEAFKEQSIDFNNMTVLAYFDQIRGSGGYTVEFASVSQTSKSIQAHIKRTASDGNDIEIMTQPYSIVLIEKTDKTVVFIKK